MALEVLYANSVDSLARELADHLREQVADDPLASPMVVVPGRALSAVVERRVAERLGVAMSLRRIGARGLWSRVAETAGLSVVEPRGLAAELLSRAQTSPALGEVRAYLDAAPAEARGERGVELAVSLAGLLLQDDRERPAHIDAWLRGHRVEDAPAWQGALLAELFAPDGVSRAGSSVLPSRAVAASLARGGSVPARVHLFCPAPPAAGELDNLAGLMRGAQVTAYVTSPCRGFWEDYSPDDPRLLAALGRAGRHGVRAWNHLADHTTDDLHVDRASGTVLGRLQAEVLERARMDAAPPAPDASLTLHDCPSTAREAEIVKGIVLDALAGASQMTPPLRPDQIAIVVPERVDEEYFPRLARALAAPPSVPVAIVGRRLAETSAAAAAARTLLALPAGEITQSSLLRALCHEGVSARAPGSTAAGLRSLARRLGVRWGADARALVGTHVDRDLYHWDQALSRLSLGFFADASPEVVDHGRGAWLAFPVAEEDAVDAAALVDGGRRLLSDTASLAAASLSLTDWAAALGAYLDTYLVDDDRDAGRQAALDACTDLAALDVDGRLVDYAVAARWLEAALDEVEDPGGEPLFEGVTMGALSAIAASPARLCVLVGASESALPQPDTRHPLDVGATPRARSPSQADRDRYHVLTRLADTERLAITWVGRDGAGDVCPPSPIVGDVRAAVTELGGPELVEALTRVHPTNRAEGHDGALRPRALALEAQMQRLAAAWRHEGPPARDLPELLARLAPREQEKLASLLSLSPPPAESSASRRASLGQLRRFVEDPLSAADWITGLGDDDEEDTEPLEGDSLLRAIVLRPAIVGADGDLARARELRDGLYLRRELAARAPAGFFGARERAAQDALLEAWAAAGDLSGYHEIALGPGRALGSRVDRRATAQLGRWELRGVTPPMTHDLGASIAFAPSKAPTERHALPSLLALTVLAALGEALPDPHLVRVFGAAESLELAVATPTRDDARGWLEALLEDLAAGPPPYVVTFKAAAGAKTASQLAERVEDELRNPRFPRRGPLARLALDPPDGGTSAWLMTRRFDFLLQRLRKVGDA